MSAERLSAERLEEIRRLSTARLEAIREAQKRESDVGYYARLVLAMPDLLAHIDTVQAENEAHEQYAVQVQESIARAARERDFERDRFEKLAAPDGEMTRLQVENERLHNRVESLEAVNRMHNDWRAKVQAEIDANEVRYVTRSSEQHAHIKRLQDQVAALREALEKLAKSKSNGQYNAPHTYCRLCAARLVEYRYGDVRDGVPDREVPDQPHKSKCILADTEAVAREWAKRERLEGARDAHERWIDLYEASTYGPMETFECVLADMEREAAGFVPGGFSLESEWQREVPEA